MENSFLSNSLTITDYILIYPALINASIIEYSFLFSIIFLILLVFLIWGIFYVANSENQENLNVKEFKNIWSFLYDLNDKVILTPIIGLSMANFYCFSNSTCFGIFHIIVIFIGVLNFCGVILL